MGVRTRSANIHCISIHNVQYVQRSEIYKVEVEDLILYNTMSRHAHSNRGSVPTKLTIPATGPRRKCLVHSHQAVASHGVVAADSSDLIARTLLLQIAAPAID